MSPEVLIYVQNVKKFFKNDIEARNYFLNEIDEELFFKYLTEISQKNFEKEGEPILTKEQFESIRKRLLIININVTKRKSPSYEDDKIESYEKEKNIFIDLKNFGKICLN
jgi:hypothetical protein